MTLSNLIVYSSLFCVGMGLVTIYHQWKARPPLAIGVIVTIIGVSVVIGLVAEAVYKSPLPLEWDNRTALYLGGLIVTSLGLVLLTIATRIQIELRAQA